MRRPGRTFGPFPRWLQTFIALLALASQLTLALASLAEVNGGRALASHVESTTPRHAQSHNEANCAACQARAVHGTVARVVPAVIVFAAPTALTVQVETCAPRWLATLPGSPRAPPAMT
jgi:hypothetical protein